MSALLSLATAAYTVTSLALTALAALAWRRSGTTRHALLTGAFALFALSGIVASVWLFRTDDALGVLAFQMAAGTLALTLLYLAVVKR